MLKDAQCLGKRPVVSASKGASEKTMFTTNNTTFPPCILHMCVCVFMAFGTQKLPASYNALLKDTMKAANNWWHSTDEEASPDGQEAHRLFAACETVAAILGISGSAADAAVRNVGDILRKLYHSSPPEDGLEDRTELAACAFQRNCELVGSHR